jgi:predicted neutral ceramidase superfamily lipid hydrolase
MRYMSSTTVIKISLFVRDDFPDYPLPLCVVYYVCHVYTHTVLYVSASPSNIRASSPLLLFLLLFLVVIVVFDEQVLLVIHPNGHKHCNDNTERN